MLVKPNARICVSWVQQDRPGLNHDAVLEF